MDTAQSEQGRFRLTKVDDVSGLEPVLRDEVSASTGAVESASAALRSAVAEMHRSEDKAWQRYAAELEQATLRLDAQLGMASARLRADRAASKPEIRDVLTQVAETWRARADEIRIQTQLGKMDARDAGLHRLEDLDHATHRVSELATSVLDDVSESIGSLRSRVTAVLDDIGQRARDSSRS